MTLAARRRSQCEPNESTEYCRQEDEDARNIAVSAALVLDGLLQAARTIMVVVGVAVPKTLQVRDGTTAIAFHPASFGRGTFGASADGVF
jgi:hypothetical protein